MTDTAVLIKEIPAGLDSDGNEVFSTVEKEIYVDVKSISSAEFYKAAQNNNKPAFRLDTFYLDYGGEPKLRYQGAGYSIYRTYTRQDEEVTELYIELDFGISGESGGG